MLPDAKARRSAAFVGVLAMAVALGPGCSIQHEIVAKGKSEATITINKKIPLHVKGPIKFPPAFPVVGGLELGEGASIDIEIEAGTQIKLDDKVDISGANAHTSSATGVRAATGVLPKALGTTTFSGSINPGSTYTWYIPTLLGDNPAVVPVTGTVSAVALDDALVPNDTGGWTLRTGGLLSFAYQVTGGSAVWRAPMRTPYGLIDGSGTISSVGDMLFAATGDVNAIAGGGTANYTDPDGTLWQYGYSGSFAVQLGLNGVKVGTGRTTVDGGVDVY